MLFKLIPPSNRLGVDSSRVIIRFTNSNGFVQNWWIQPAKLVILAADHFEPRILRILFNKNGHISNQPEGICIYIYILIVLYIIYIKLYICIYYIYILLYSYMVYIGKKGYMVLGQNHDNPSLRLMDGCSPVIW